MGKRILSMCLALCMVMSLIVALPVTVSAETSGDLTYEVNDDAITITDCDESAILVEIPSEIDGIPVTTIGEYAFNYCSRLISITIPDSVTTISNFAFSHCGSLTSITIPDSVTTIGGYAFYCCKSLTSITIPDSVTTIGGWAFGCCTSLISITVVADNPNYSSLNGNLYNKNKTKLIRYAIGKKDTSFSIPDSVTTIGEYALYNCESLISVTIPDSVTSIGEFAFYYCDNLKDVYYSGAKEQWQNIRIGSYNFPLTSATIHYNTEGAALSSQCGDNVYWSLDNNGTLTISGSGDMYDYESPSDVPWYNSNSSVKKAIIESGVTTISNFAFYYCKSLTSATIPNSITSIGKFAFYECEKLKSITIPDSVTSIGRSVFSECRSLTSITIPDSVTSISNFAFSYCSSLISITIPDSVTSIGEYAFEYCSSLISITIPESVTSIGGDAFRNTSLTSITIPDSVTSIGEDAFFYCDNLISIMVVADNPNYSSLNGNLYNKNKTKLIRYAIGKKDTSFSIPDSVTSIGNSAFEHCRSLTSITIPDSVTFIGEGAFYYCDNLISITIPESVSSIGGHTFFHCDNLISITIPDSVTSIGKCAFWYCDNLISIIIPDSVTSIGEVAFYYCDNLKDVYYSGTKEQWKKISIGYYNSPLTSAKIHYNRTLTISVENQPYVSNQIADQNGTTDLDSISNNSKPHYNNTVKDNSSITGDYTIKDSNVTVANGKTLNISGKLTIENGNLYIEKGGKVTAQSVEIKTKGRMSVNGELSTSSEIVAKGGSNSGNGGCIVIGQSGTMNTGNVSLYDYARISLYGKLYANSFLIKTKTNLSNFGSKGEMWLKGDFTQQKNGALWWQSGADNFCPSSGFSVLFENNGYTHNISFDTPGQSYFYNLYSVTNGSTTAVWEGNPEIKGATANVRKNSSGYTINKKDNTESIAAVKDFKSEIASIVNGKSATSVSYGISEFGGMYSETNNALKKYLYAYTAGIDALYPSVIDVSTHTWYEKIPVYYNGKYRDVKFGFEIVNWMGNKVVNVKYSYGNTQNKQCFTFFSGNKNELANAIRKYATDTYNSAIADYLCTPLDKYVKNKKSKLADLLWDGIQNISVIGTGSGKKTVKNIIKKGVNKYLDKVEKTIGTSVYSYDVPVAFSIDNTMPTNNDGIALLSENETQEPVETPPTETADTFTDTYLISALKEKLGTDELTQENLEAVEELDLSSSYITNLTGIGQCKNLKKLDLSGNAVSDLTPISELTDLQILDLNGNSVSDLKPIANLTNLQSLTLKNNLLTDLSGLENLSALTDLDLAFNTIVDILPLQNLVNIQRLNITNNNISDISSIANCKELKELYAGANKISDISALSDMVLEKLNIAQNKVSNIDCINVTDLSGLDISENDISDISVLVDANTLSDLNVGGNAINDISAVAGKTAMTTLNISDNSIVDIGSLAQLTSLTELNCANNNITDFSVLSNLLSLMSLDVSNNAIEDFTFVKDLTALQTLYASGCDLYSDDMLNLPSSVEKLDVSSNTIMEVIPFVSMNYLTKLNLSNNYISDISEFSAITHNMSLNVNGNEVSDESINALHTAMQDSGYYISVTNNASPVALQNMYFMKDTAEVKTGDEFLQQVSVMPYNADSSVLIWESSNTNVAEVEKGIVKGKMPGQTTITAKTADGELSASYNLTVIDDIFQEVSVNNNTVTVSLKNITDTNYDSVKLLIGIYDKEDNMQDVKIIKINNFVSGYADDDIEIPFNSIPSESHVKVLLWESLSDVRPLAEYRQFIVE